MHFSLAPGLDNSGLAYEFNDKVGLADRLHGHANSTAAEVIEKQKRAEDALWDELASDTAERAYKGIERDASPFTESSGSSRDGSFLRREAMEGRVNVSDNLLALDPAEEIRRFAEAVSTGQARKVAATLSVLAAHSRGAPRLEPAALQRYLTNVSALEQGRRILTIVVSRKEGRRALSGHEVENDASREGQVASVRNRRASF
jgi:hypothetical protein